MGALFISDLHLDPGRPQARNTFVAFLQRQAAQADALYILGDLFDTWIGEDDGNLAVEIAGHLRQLGKAGTAVFLMVGNRDFLLGASFLRNAGCTLLPDPSCIRIGHQTVLLMHGDQLCIDDHDYQRMRRIIRSRACRALLLALPLALRRGIASWLRRRSRAATSAKAASIMDANPREAERCIREARADVLIHGHTHRPATHRHAAGVRYVLGDWNGRAIYLDWPDEGEAALREFSP